MTACNALSQFEHFTLKTRVRFQKGGGVRPSGGILPVRNGSIEPSQGILLEQRTG